jgi:formamidopyrimidine-DNA glycosylase
MPELPEVHTTVTGLQQVLPGNIITDVWSDMWSMSQLAKNTIKDRYYFPYLKETITGAKITSVSRRAKYILIHLNNSYTLVIHMKMTGHLMYGKYRENKSYNKKEWSWIPLVTDNANLMQTTKKNVHPLLDPYNRHIHVVFTLSNRHHLVFCDSRKFGTITVQKSETLYTVHLKHVGPEPLETNFTLQNFKERLLRSPLRAIKTVLMDQSIIAGIGNIYSDEMLHRSHIPPTRTPKSLHETEWKLLFTSMKQVLNKGIDFGGDSTSDYRNIYGERGAFHANHLVYLRTKEKCLRKGCAGVIIKKPLNGRSSHFCPVCQK